ncbi:MAG: prepilin-type N-terminal cleavage/methylation domain-containing protein [Verrucomicrobiota bacterium]
MRHLKQNQFSVKGNRGKRGKTCYLHSQGGFSLLELLVVVGIIALLSTASIVGLRSVASSRAVQDTASGIAGTVELARSIAMSQNTYVWLGIEQVNNLTNQPTDVVVSLVRSIDGTADLTAANLRPVNKLQRYSNVQLADFSSSPPPASGPMSARSTSQSLMTSGSSTAIFNWPPTGGTPLHIFNNVLRFGPDGSVLLEGLTSYAMIEVGLQEANTPAVTDVSVGNIAAVQVDGVTGRSRIFLP